MCSEELLRGLAPLARKDTRTIAHSEKFSFLSAFVTRRTETFQATQMPVSGLLVVLEGVKQLWWAGRHFTFGPGMAFALPARTSVDVMNEIDSRTGIYRALFLGFSSDLLTEARRRWSALAAGPMAADPTVQIDPALASAILHTSEALAGKVVVSEQVIEQRILEVLLLMAEAGAAPLRPDMKHCALTEAVRFIIRHNPAQTWEAAQVASELNTSESTLRRHLRHEGASFRQIVVEERMRAARSMLMAGRISVTEAAIVSGYASLSHFTKRFRTTYGCLPSEFLPNGAISP